MAWLAKEVLVFVGVPCLRRVGTSTSYSKKDKQSLEDRVVETFRIHEEYAVDDSSLGIEHTEKWFSVCE